MLPGPTRFVLILVLSLILSPSVSHFAFAFKTSEFASIVIGQSSFNTKTCSGVQNGFCNPMDGEFDASGDLWVADNSNCRVLEFSAPLSGGENASIVIGQPNFTTGACSVSQNGFFGPAAVAFDAKGNLWVVDQAGCRVMEFEAPFSNEENASVVIGEPNFATALCYIGGSDTQNGLDFPQGLVFDSSGNLWVSDDGSSRVLEFSPPFSNYENASLVIGQSSFTAFNCTTTQNGLCFPGTIRFA